MSKSDIRFYVDTLIVETVLGDPSLIKNADADGILSGLVPMIHSYVGSHIDQNDKAGSVINMLTPGLLFELFSSFGFTKMGLLIAFATSVLHIDIAKTIEPLFQTVKDTLSRGENVTPSQIDQAVSETVQQNTPSDDSPALDSSSQLLQHARMLRLSLEQYEQQVFRLTKEGAPILVSYGAGRGARTTILLGRILGWIFKTILISAGFMVAGDVVNKMLGRPNAIDGNYQAGQTPPSTSSSVTPTPVTSQTKFPINPSFQNTPEPQPWAENVTNDQSSIENMLVNFTKDVYTGLDGKESAIQSSPTFQGVRDQIVWYNKAAAGEPKVYLPTMYTNKKAIVDHYIDQVANTAV